MLGIQCIYILILGLLVYVCWGFGTFIFDVLFGCLVFIICIVFAGGILVILLSVFIAWVVVAVYGII